MSYIGNSPGAGPTNKIEQGDSSVEVIDTGTGRIEFTTDGTKVAEIDASGNMKFNSGYGSVATVYGCRAWVNFNGLGTVTIRESGNVSSITDNANGDYTVNFATAMPDANYAGVVSGGWSGNVSGRSTVVNGAPALSAPTTSAFRFRFTDLSIEDEVTYAQAAFFR